MQRPTVEDFMRRYFLGDLSQEEMHRAEDQYLTHTDTLEQFQAAENDLIDLYVHGELSEDERRKFERQYLTTPEGREKVAFARALKQVCAAEQVVASESLSSSKRMANSLAISAQMPRWALAVAALIVVTSELWLISHDARLRVDLHQALARQTDLSREADALRQQVAELHNSHADKNQQSHGETEVAGLGTTNEQEFPIRLIPDITRGSTTQQIMFTLRPNIAGFKLQLLLDQNEYHTYEATLLTAGGKEVLRATVLRSHVIDGNTVVTWHVPPRSISAGDYIVRLKGRSGDGHLEVADSYSFRVLP